VLAGTAALQGGGRADAGQAGADDQDIEHGVGGAIGVVLG
jgi:hypothetical protein